jgi:predicted DNA-binding antitoxin AbrB/MazE fold protein
MEDAAEGWRCQIPPILYTVASAHMNNPATDNSGNTEKPAVTLPAVVEKIVKPVDPSEPEKAQIVIHGAEDLYKEIRIENTLEDSVGEKVKLKPGAAVEVTIEAPANAVEKKNA